MPVAGGATFDEEGETVLPKPKRERLEKSLVYRREREPAMMRLSGRMLERAFRRLSFTTEYIYI